MVLREITCRSILSPSRIPGVAYAINPYVGCGHGCLYCYAVFMKRFTNHQEPWGQFVDVKINGPRRLLNDLRRATPGQVLLSSVTDPYQPAEETYQITKACLDVLQQARVPVSLLTKSALVLRDIDVLTQMRVVDVGFTVTTLDDEIRAAFEPHSSSVEERFRAIRLLSNAGIHTWIFFGPVLPYFSDREETMSAFFHEAEQSGADHILVDGMNLYPEVWRRTEALLRARYPWILPYYRRVREEKKAYFELLRERVKRVAQRHAIRWRIVF